MARRMMFTFSSLASVQPLFFFFFFPHQIATLTSSHFLNVPAFCRWVVSDCLFPRIRLNDLCLDTLGFWYELCVCSIPTRSSYFDRDLRYLLFVTGREGGKKAVWCCSWLGWMDGWVDGMGLIRFDQRCGWRVYRKSGLQWFPWPRRAFFFVFV